MRPLYVALVAVYFLTSGERVASVLGQQRGGKAPSAAVQKLRDGVYRVGPIEVDTTKKELTVPAMLNRDVTILEFVANTAKGSKAYESAMTISTDAITFNTALLLIGLDPAHARVPKQHFDPVAPKGDPVDIWLDWDMIPDVTSKSALHARVEELLYDERTKTTMPSGPWVYTGSTLMNGRFMADNDGVLIGFVHSPAPLIENPRAGAVSAYGSIVLNPKFKNYTGAIARLTVKALPASK